MSLYFYNQDNNYKFLSLCSFACKLPVYLQTVFLRCVGEGPVVHVAPLAMNWGTIPVLTDSSRVMVLSNESLIPARFKAYMVSPSHNRTCSY